PDFLLYWARDPCDVHSFPTRRSSDLRAVWDRVRAVPSPSAARAVEQSLRDARERWTDADGVLDETAWSEWVRAVLANEWNASERDRKSTRLNSSHVKISYAVFCLKKK